MHGSDSPGLGEVARILEERFGWTLQGDNTEDQRFDTALRKGMLYGYWSYTPITPADDIKQDQDGRYIISNKRFARLGDGFEPQIDIIQHVLEGQNQLPSTE